jgi:hypothetical protein
LWGLFLILFIYSYRQPVSDNFLIIFLTHLTALRAVTLLRRIAGQVKLVPRPIAQPSGVCRLQRQEKLCLEGTSCLLLKEKTNRIYRYGHYVRTSTVR